MTSIEIMMWTGLCGRHCSWRWNGTLRRSKFDPPQHALSKFDPPQHALTQQASTRLMSRQDLPTTLNVTLCVCVCVCTLHVGIQPGNRVLGSKPRHVRLYVQRCSRCCTLGCAGHGTTLAKPNSFRYLAPTVDAVSCDML